MEPKKDHQWRQMKPVTFQKPYTGGTEREREIVKADENQTLAMEKEIVDTSRNISVEVLTNGEILSVKNVKSIKQISYPTYMDFPG